MSKHTPGPWQIIGGYNIYSELGGQSGDGDTADASDGWHIASIGDAPTFVGGEEVYLSRDLQRANARLISAAPDLLEALDGMVSKAQKQNWNDNYPEELNAAYKAIAKARGEE